MSIDSLEHLQIVRACEDLVRRSIALSDAGQWRALADLYAEDAMMSRPSDPDRWIAGRGAILESFLGRPPRTSRHLIGNLLVDVRSRTEAVATTTVALFVGPAIVDVAPVRTTGPTLIGAYDDQLRHEGGQWRIARRAGSLALEHGAGN